MPIEKKDLEKLKLLSLKASRKRYISPAALEAFSEDELIRKVAKQSAIEYLNRRSFSRYFWFGGGFIGGIATIILIEILILYRMGFFMLF